MHVHPQNDQERCVIYVYLHAIDSKLAFLDTLLVPGVCLGLGYER